MRRTCLLFLFFFIFKSSFSQQTQLSSAEIYQSLRKLNVLGSVLYIAAHPDDENTRLLTYLAKEKHYRTGYLSITRGDGGQNLIGNEQGIELGLIRTQELLAARRIDGAEQFFTRAYDFGFSKSPEETFDKWGKEKILYDVVWVIRKFKPDVIISRFPTTGEGGHGHHTASAILASEGFTAAADSTRFKDQFEYGLTPWKAKRLLWNTFNFGGNNQTREDQLKVDVGAYNAVLGKSYGEIAAVSRSQHKSQGFGVPMQRGSAIEYFTTISGEPPVKDLMDGVSTTWSRISNGSTFQQQVNGIISSFEINQPEKSVDPLIDLYKQLYKLRTDDATTEKLQSIQTLIEQCAGLFIEVSTPQQFAAIGDSLSINVTVVNRSNANVSKVSLMNRYIERKPLTFDSTTYNKLLTKSYTTKIIEGALPSQPYWLALGMNRAAFGINNNYNIGLPQNATDTFRFIYTINDLHLETYRSVFYKYTDPVKGEQLHPVIVTPRISVTVQPSVVLSNVIPAIEPSLKITYQSYFNNEKLPVSFHIRQGANTDLWIQDTITRFAYNTTNSKQISLKPLLKTIKQNNVSELSAEMEAPWSAFNKFSGEPNREDLKGVFSVSADSKIKFSKALKVIEYDYIPKTHYFYTDKVVVVNEEIKTAGKKIGYITGAGDYVLQALEQMGYDVTILNDNNLATIKLNQFDAIISGVRAYNTNPWLNDFYDKLMNYIEQGGNLIVQYNTSNRIGPVRAKIGPYNFTINRNRISDENAPVTFLKPEHPVLNYPNKITNNDFKGWVQERSIYHASELDNNFETVVSMNDPGEKSDEGSLIVAKYGKGFFTYTGLVFFRQLPAGVAGAYRLIANLIALNKKK
ncbi:MAG: PIG-L family deacetylase [Chitinophagaceae bacterium]